MPYCLLFHSKKANLVFNQSVSRYSSIIAMLQTVDLKKPRLHLSLWALFYHFRVPDVVLSDNAILTNTLS